MRFNSLISCLTCATSAEGWWEVSTKNDFTIFEDGKQQDVKIFQSYETDLPLTIELADRCRREPGNLIETERNAAYQFFGSVLRKQDLAFLISFGSEAELLQDYTNSATLLRRGLEGLQVNSDVGGLHPGPVPTISQPRGTILYDAVYLAASDQLKGQVGRKVLVLITDGEDQGSRYKIAQAIEAAQRADAILYGFYYVDRAFYYGHGLVFGGVSDSELRRMSEETGGHVFHVDRKLTLQDAFSELQNEMRSQYAIGYTSTNANKDGTFRKIEIKTNNKDWKVQARKGYYASSNTLENSLGADIRISVRHNRRRRDCHRAPAGNVLRDGLSRRSSAGCDGRGVPSVVASENGSGRVPGVAGGSSGWIYRGGPGFVADGLAAAHGGSRLAAREYSECLLGSGQPETGAGAATDGAGAGVVQGQSHSRSHPAFEQCRPAVIREVGISGDQ